MKKISFSKLFKTACLAISFLFIGNFANGQVTPDSPIIAEIRSWVSSETHTCSDIDNILTKAQSALNSSANNVYVKDVLYPLIGFLVMGDSSRSKTVTTKIPATKTADKGKSLDDFFNNKPAPTKTTVIYSCREKEQEIKDFIKNKLGRDVPLLHMTAYSRMSA